MAPKKEKVQKLSLGDFLAGGDSFGAGGGSWADEVEDTYVSGTQALPPPQRNTGYSTSSYGGAVDRGYSSVRDNLPQTLPDRPPYTAHLGNLSYDATDETVKEFFEGCNLVSVRIIEDRELQRPKGFAYAEFQDVEGLKTALTRDGQTFQGRSIRIKIADPPKGGRDGGFESNRDLSDWSRKGPLPDLPGRDRPERRPFRDAPADDGKVRDFGNWERRGPLSPLAPTERPGRSRDTSVPRSNDGRSDNFRDRRASPAAWGPGEGRQDGSRPPRREFADRPERPERVPTAAEKDSHWRNSMRPDQSREGSETPASPSAQHAVPSRPKLQLTKRTVSEAQTTSPSQSGDAKASPFGAARPIDTAAREREIEEKRLQAIQEKKEAEEKAKEEKRLAKEAAAKEAAEKAEQAEKAEAEAAAKAAEEAAKPAEEPKEAKEPKESKESKESGESASAAEQKAPARPREPRENVANPKSRAQESGNWRSASGPQRLASRDAPSGPRGRGGPARAPRSDSGRGPRANGNAPAQAQQPQSDEQSPATPTADEDGWTTVATGKARRGRA